MSIAGGSQPVGVVPEEELGLLFVVEHEAFGDPGERLEVVLAGGARSEENQHRGRFGPTRCGSREFRLRARTGSLPGLPSSTAPVEETDRYR